MATETTPKTEAPAKATVVAPVPKKKKAYRAYMIVLGLAAAVVGAYFIHGYITRDEVDTDDAQIDADVVPISARVAGVVLKMKVEDNQKVEAGAVIAEIDPDEYAKKVDAAQAELDVATEQAAAADEQVEIVKSTSGGALSSAKANLLGTSASVGAAHAQVASAQAALARAKSELSKATSEYQRQKTLHDQGAVSGQALEGATTARDSAQAAVDAATANVASARDQEALSQSRVVEAQGHVTQSTPIERQIAVAVAVAKQAHYRIAAAQAALATAKLHLTYTKIVAPTTGFVSKLAVHDGQMVQPGMTVLMVVPARLYVVANFKETQMSRIAAGNKVDFTVDALGGRTFHGKVASISAGTGARFSMMPPDNATGNFVKVVQRIPVKIALDDGQDTTQLHAGLSVEVKVHLEH
jgi:membrane fusion protein (multidrug efflux system)